MPVIDYFSGTKILSDFLDLVLTKRGTRLEKKIEAVSLMQKAINNTDAHLTLTKQEYLPNAILSNLWNDAFKSMLSVDRKIAIKLNQKSRFWSNPKKWIDEPASMESILTLKELQDRCDSILTELENRKG